jgi:hypothetical protein
MVPARPLLAGHCQPPSLAGRIGKAFSSGLDPEKRVPMEGPPATRLAGSVRAQTSDVGR